MRYRLTSQGFALPTVVITSVIMFAVLVAAVGVVSSSRASLDTQFYEGIASDAAESGATHASSCLADNNYVSSWSTNDLHPDTSCSGGAGCTNLPKCFVLQDKPDPVNRPNFVDYRSTYTVAPVQNMGNGVQIVTITGVVQLVRPDGQVWNTYTKSLKIRVGAQIASNQVAMGYAGGEGSFFATVGKDGSMRAAGYNGNGQLGNRTLLATLTPTKFEAPTSNPIISAYTSFVSVGRELFAIDSQGGAYGAGRNDYGQVGVGVSGSTPNIMTPQKVQVPVGVKVRNVTLAMTTTYFLGDDNNIYAAGNCDYGQLGSNYAIAGCVDKPTPVRVNLPTPNTSNPNTIPVDVVSDRYNAYVRMQGGSVYGWGENSVGQLGNGDLATSVSSPVKIGTYGDAGQPGARQIVFDGGMLSILDNAGNVQSIGNNMFGSMGTGVSNLKSYGAPGTCLENTSGNGTSVGLGTCDSVTKQLFEIRSDGRIYNAAKNVCLSTVDGVGLVLQACTTNVKQVFTWDPVSNQVTNNTYTKCITNQGTTAVQLATCSSSGTQNFGLIAIGLVSFDKTNIPGAITKIWTDQSSLSVLTDTGEVWSAGLNISGQFGNGTVGYWNSVPVKFNSPVPMTDIYQTNYGVVSVICYQNLFAIGNNGRIYGAGGNCFGQLGNGSTTASAVSTPVAMNVIDGSGIKAANVQSAYGTTVITTTTGNIYTVGNNSDGQLGDGTTTNRSTPIYSKYINPQNGVSY